MASTTEQNSHDRDLMDRAFGRDAIRRRELARLVEGLRRFRVTGLSVGVLVLLWVLSVEELTWQPVSPSAVIVLFVLIVAVDLYRLRPAASAPEGPSSVTVDLFLAVLGQTAVVGLTGGIESPLLFVIIALPFAGGVMLGPGLHSRAVLLAVLFVPWLLVVAGARAWTPRTVPELLALDPGFADRMPYTVTRASVVNLACIFVYRLGLWMYVIINRMIDAALDARRTALETQRERNRELVQLSSAIAHELKNPLATIKGLVQLVERGDKNAQRRFAVLHREIDRTRSILDEFLNFSRPLGALSTERVDLAVLLDDLTALHEGLAAEAGARVDPPPRGPSRASRIVAGDPRKLGQALTNLLQNAIEASSPGSRVEWVLSTGDGTVTVGVRDEGPGIDEAVLGRISQLGATTKPGGSGIGLAVARTIAEQHGGRLEIGNREVGCRAVLVLPAAPDKDDL